MQASDDDATLARINAAVNLIVHNLRTQFAVRDVAQQLDMSERVFTRFFRGAAGNSFTDFVNRLRINRACPLLMETERMDTERYVNNICYHAGVNNVANFNRRFPGVQGDDPTQFRRQAAGRFGA